MQCAGSRIVHRERGVRGCVDAEAYGELVQSERRQHAAEIARMSMHRYPNASNKFHTGSVLFGVKSQVTNHPNNGIEWGRGESWPHTITTASSRDCRSRTRRPYA